MKKLSPLTFYVLAAVSQTSGSSGAAMLGPFFMKAHGYSIALAGIPLVANGIGRVCSDLMSGVVATYLSPGALLIAATAIGIMTSVTGYLFLDHMPVFVGAWIVFGVTEAMFALALRKVGFDQAAPDRQGRVQGQMASALGVGFTLGPLLGGFVGKWMGPDGVYFVYAVPQSLAFILILVAGAHRYRRATRPISGTVWREAAVLLKKPPFLASCLAICQCFFFLTGVTRVAFPFLATNYRGMTLDAVGTLVSISRMTDTFGRYTGGWLCDRIRPSQVILLGVAIGVPMFALQGYGAGYLTLLIPLVIMTTGFGFTNVGATTFALQSATAGTKEIALGVSRASTSIGQTLGPLFCGAVIEKLGYERGFQAMGAVSLVVLIVVWFGMNRETRHAQAT
jgi:predicted MFS family arabinose efflux permease